MLRIFVAIALPEPLKEGLSWLYGGVPGARWLDEDAVHLTLRFIGEVDGHAFSDVVAALDRIALPPFELSLAGVGHFPPRRAARALWAGVAPSEALRRLRERVDRAVVSAGLPPEHRKYHPHVTIARLDGAPQDRVMRFLAENALFRSEPFEVDAFHLYSSQLHAKGAQYTLEETFSLCGE